MVQTILTEIRQKYPQEILFKNIANFAPVLLKMIADVAKIHISKIFELPSSLPDVLPNEELPFERLTMSDSVPSEGPPFENLPVPNVTQVKERPSEILTTSEVLPREGPPFEKLQISEVLPSEGVPFENL